MITLVHFYSSVHERHTGNTYKIFDQPDVPAINMYYHFHVWMMVLRAILQRDLRPDELVFPQINGNGLVYS